MHIYIYIISKSRSVTFNVVSLLLSQIISHITIFFNWFVPLIFLIIVIILIDWLCRFILDGFFLYLYLGLFNFTYTLPLDIHLTLIYKELLPNFFFSFITLTQLIASPFHIVRWPRQPNKRIYIYIYMWVIIGYSRSTINAYSLLSHNCGSH